MLLASASETGRIDNNGQQCGIGSKRQKTNSSNSDDDDNDADDGGLFYENMTIMMLMGAR